MIVSAQRLFLLFILFCAFFASANQIFAQSTPQQNPYAVPNTNPDVPQNLHTLTQSVVIEVLAALNCQLIGIDVTSPSQKCLGIDPQNGKIGFVEGGGGLIGITGNMIATLYTPPASSSDYVAYVSSEFGLVKKAHAQVGLGYTGLKPLLEIWKTFRNLTYLLFVLIFALIGFAIMLRVKIDPRTVMTIENQVPKMIVGIILVTFSFAIAGFLIDLMYIAIYGIFNTFTDPSLVAKSRTAKYIDDVIQAQKTFNGENPFGILEKLLNTFKIITGSAGGVKDIVQSLFAAGTSLDLGAKDSFSIPVLTGIWKILNFNAKEALGGVLGWLAGTLALLIIAGAILWAMFRLWFQLIMAYVSILIDVVLAPFWIVAGLVPDSPIGFGPWLRDIIGNLAAFPVAIGMFLMARVFFDVFADPTITDPFIAPLIGNPLRNDLAPIGSLIALGIIWMTPQVVNMTKELIKSPQFKYGAALGEAFGAGQRLAGVPKSSVGAMWEAHHKTPMPGAAPGSTHVIMQRLFGGH